MGRKGRVNRRLSWGLALAYLLPFWQSPAAADTFVLKDGRVLEGKHGIVASLAENPLAQAASGVQGAVKPILLVDDELRRIFVPKSQVIEIKPQNNAAVEKILIPQRVALTGARIGQVGPIV